MWRSPVRVYHHDGTTVKRAQNGPGNFAKGWKYSLYMTMKMIYDRARDVASTQRLGYENSLSLPWRNMLGVCKNVRVWTIKAATRRRKSSKFE
jgi:hypothetical protein